MHNYTDKNVNRKTINYSFKVDLDTTQKKLTLTALNIKQNYIQQTKRRQSELLMAYKEMLSVAINAVVSDTELLKNYEFEAVATGRQTNDGQIADIRTRRGPESVVPNQPLLNINHNFH